ncbi:MAG: MucR family transcriptional regulator [Desulfovibrionaceae bacterium]|nr:MucR family transcriptional regulator [Desulfovibrionaceae bacterium]
MSDEAIDVKIFEIVYNKHPNEPMTFIQEEALKMQIAMHQNKMYLKHILDNPSNEKQFMPNATQAMPKPKKEKPAIDAAAVRDVSTWRISDPEEMKNSIGDDEIKCCICHNEKQHFKTLNRHLRGAHGISPEEYRTLCGINQNIPLMAKKVYEAAAQRMRTKDWNNPPANASAQQAPQGGQGGQGGGSGLDINPPLGPADIFTQPTPKQG